MSIKKSIELIKQKCHENGIHFFEKKDFVSQDKWLFWLHDINELLDEIGELIEIDEQKYESKT